MTNTDLIQRRAYELFEKRGCELGHDLDDWLTAEREVLDSHAAEIAARTTSHRRHPRRPEMKPVLVLYATREGHTRRIADHLAAAIRGHGLAADLVSAVEIPAGFSLDGYAAAMLTASVHGGRHEREITRFVKLHLAGLERIPAAFLSVSLSEAGAENARATPERRAEAKADAQRMIEAFLTETGWRPARVQAVAGALLYSEYNFVLRFVMKRIARQAGGDEDTSRDYVYTDWRALDRFVDEFAATLTSLAEKGG